MGPRWIRALVLEVLFSALASSQVVQPDVQKYLKLTVPQVQSITDLNTQLTQYFNNQMKLYNRYAAQAYTELSQDSPDPGTVGNAYAQMEMIRRDYRDQLAQEQSKVAAVLTPDQQTLLNPLLDAVRMQPLVSEAACVGFNGTVPTGAVLTVPSTLSFSRWFVTDAFCGAPPIPTAISMYLGLSDPQVAAIENALLSNQDYRNRQQLKISELQVEIRDLTAAPTIDAAKLGADYIAIQQIQQDQTRQNGQLGQALGTILNDQQHSLLAALGQASSLYSTALAAVTANILVLPPNLQMTKAICDPFSSSFSGCFNALGLSAFEQAVPSAQATSR